MKKIIRYCTLGIVMLLGICIALVLLEFGSRLFYKQRYPPWQTEEDFQRDVDLIYSFKPNAVRCYITEEFEEYAKINSLGLRGDEISDHKDYLKRIVIIGDSFTYGHGVSTEYSYPNQLERLFLEKEGKKVEVMNAGVLGYGTDQSYKFFKTRLYALKPDILIFSLNHNDVGNNIQLPLYTIKEGRLYPLDATKNWLYFLSNIYFNTPAIFKKSYLFNFVLTRLENKDIFGLLPSKDRGELVEWSKKKIMLELQDLYKTAKENNFKFVVACMPSSKNIPEGTYSAFKFDCDDKDYLFINSSNNPAWSDNRLKLFFKKDGHLTPEGNRVLAEQVYYSIRDLCQ